MKTVRLETVFSSFQKQGVFLRISQVFISDSGRYYVVFVDFCIVFYCSGSICENVISLVNPTNSPSTPLCLTKIFLHLFSETVIHTRPGKSFFQASGFPHIPQKLSPVGCAVIYALV